MIFFNNLLIKNSSLFLEINFIVFIKLFFFLIISVINIISDIKYKKVFSYILMVMTILFLTINFFINYTVFINSIIGVIITALIFLIIYYVSKGGIGLGDMFYMMFISSLFGYFFTLTGFVISFWFASVFLIIPYSLKKIGRKSKIAMIPFLFSGTGTVIIFGIITVL